LQLGNLQLVRHTADDVGDAQTAAMLHQVNRIIGNLLSQFAGWAHDQCARRWRLEVTHIGGVFALGALGRCLALGYGFSHFAFERSTLVDFRLCQLLQQGVQHGQQEGGGLSATGLARDHQVDETGGLLVSVFAWQRQRNGFELNRCRLGITQVFDGVNQLGSQAQQDEAIRQFGGGFNGVNRIGRNQFGSDANRGFLHCEISRNNSGKGFVRRKSARHCESVSHGFTHTRVPQGMRLLRQWLKNINHQTEPAANSISAWGPNRRTR